VLQLIKYVFVGFALIWLLMISSCFMVGAGTAVAINSVANSDIARRTSKRYDRYELARHNEIANREASVHERDDYTREYRDY
jgi:hypothetical protein